MELRSRLSRESVERQTTQPQPITGTPWEVPVPKKVTFKALIPFVATPDTIDVTQVEVGLLVFAFVEVFR